MAWAAHLADDPQVGPVAASIATATAAAESNLAGWAVLAVMAWAAWYLLACAVFPWRACTWCDGGKKRNSSGKNWRDCRHCAGSGRRPRIGRRAWQALSRSKRK